MVTPSSPQSISRMEMRRRMWCSSMCFLLCNLCEKDSNFVEEMWLELTLLIEELDNLPSAAVFSNLSPNWIYVGHALKALVETLDTLDNPSNHNKKYHTKQIIVTKHIKWMIIWRPDCIVGLLTDQNEYQDLVHVPSITTKEARKFSPSLGILGQCLCCNPHCWNWLCSCRNKIQIR